jgi:hypothetical protein
MNSVLEHAEIGVLKAIRPVADHTYAEREPGLGWARRRRL